MSCIVKGGGDDTYREYRANDRCAHHPHPTEKGGRHFPVWPVWPPVHHIVPCSSHARDEFSEVNHEIANSAAQEGTEERTQRPENRSERNPRGDLECGDGTDEGTDCTRPSDRPRFLLHSKPFRLEVLYL